MNYYYQDEEKLKINEIKNIESIKVYDILVPSKINKGILGIIVFYDGLKMLSFTELDKNFAYFFENLRRIYLSEKERNKIEIDKQSEYFLNFLNPSLDIKKIKEEVGFVKTNKKIYYGLQEVEVHFNLLKYLLENFLKFINRNVTITKISGMGKYFTLTGLEDNLESHFEFIYSKKEDNKIEFIFKGILEKTKELIIDVSYNENIEISIHNRNNTILSLITVNTEKNTETHELFINGIQKLNETASLKTQDDYKNPLNIQGIPISLPWGDIRFINTSYIEDEIEEKTVSNYKISEQTGTLEKEEKTTGGYTLITSMSEITDFLSDRNKKHIRLIKHHTIKKTLTTHGIKNKGKVTTLTTEAEKVVTNIYIIEHESFFYIIKETEFIVSPLGRGIYKSELEGNVFYKIYKIKDLENYEIIEEFNTIDEQIKGYELLDAGALSKKLLRGDY